MHILWLFIVNDEDFVEAEAAQDDNDSYVDILAVPENNPIFASPEKEKQIGNSNFHA